MSFSRTKKEVGEDPSMIWEYLSDLKQLEDFKDSKRIFNEVFEKGIGLADTFGIRKPFSLSKQRIAYNKRENDQIAIYYQRRFTLEQLQIGTLIDNLQKSYYLFRQPTPLEHIIQIFSCFNNIDFKPKSLMIYEKGVLASHTFYDERK